MCPPDTLCLRPEHFSVPTHCVHKSVMDNVAKHLSNGPVYLCNDGIIQNVIVAMLVVIILVQIALFSLFYWRSSFKKLSDNKKEKKNTRKDGYNKSLSPSICNTLTTNLELMTPRLELPTRSNPTHLCERSDQYTILTPKLFDSSASTGLTPQSPQLNFPTRRYERNEQSANSSSFSSEYSAHYHNV
uniref:Uncharacterized protein n=1 Tax=Meloidogyne enterolobii TaxID=390850 RepID=A0A6V7VQY6_MELEN|nr:unnamed protein product [Meloidogyne enterolobii]